MFRCMACQLTTCNLRAFKMLPMSSIQSDSGAARYLRSDAGCVIYQQHDRRNSHAGADETTDWRRHDWRRQRSLGCAPAGG